MKYCKGEVVKVRDDIEDLYADEKLRRRFDITNDMSKMGGKLLTIDYIDDSYYAEYAYIVRENSWFWQERLLLSMNNTRDDLESML